MYCSQCGAKLPDTAQFCSQCGEPVVAPAADDAVEKEAATPVTEVVGGDSSREAVSEIDDDSVASPLADKNLDSNKPVSEDYSDGERQSFTQRMIAFRRTTLKAVPTFVLAIFAFLAAAGTAYAAFKVVTKVVIPAIEQMADEFQGESSQEEGVSSASEKNEGMVRESKIKKMSGKPESAIQFGEMLAMTPSELPGYLESQGLSNPQNEPEGPGAEYEKTVWDWQWESVAHDLIDARLIWDGRMDIPYGLQFAVDTVGLNMPGLGQSFLSADDMKGGKKANSIRTMSIPLIWMDGDDADRFAELCGLGKVFAHCGLTEKGGSGGLAMSYMSEESSSDQWFVGFFAIEGSDYVWVLNQHEYSGQLYSSFECMSIEAAEKGVDGAGIYTVEEWQKANYDQKAMIVAQTFAEDSITSVISSGAPQNEAIEGTRLNVRTGEMERSYMMRGDYGYAWETFENLNIPAPLSGEYAIVELNDGFSDAMQLD